MSFIREFLDRFSCVKTSSTSIDKMQIEIEPYKGKPFIFDVGSGH